MLYSALSEMMGVRMNDGVVDGGEFAAAGMPTDEIIQRAAYATEAFLQAEKCILEIGVNERSLTFKLAGQLEKQFSGWDVDCEYNRAIDEVKRLVPLGAVETKASDRDAISIFPDIIVHKRKKNINILVIEVKKRGHSNAVGLDLDKIKLSGMTGDGKYKYIVGIHLIIDCMDQSIYDAVVYRSGKIDPKLTSMSHALFSAKIATVDEHERRRPPPKRRLP